MERLRRRADFKAVAGGRRASRAAFVIQALKTGSGAGYSKKAPRIGFTVTRKIGNAVVRIRARRRLREAARQAESHAEPGTDYVIVARPAALTLNFQRLVTDLKAGFDALSRPKAPETGSDAR